MAPCRSGILVIIPCFSSLSNYHFRSLGQLLRGLTPATVWTSRGHRCVPFSPPILAFILSSIEFSVPPFQFFVLVDLHQMSHKIHLRGEGYVWSLLKGVSRRPRIMQQGSSQLCRYVAAKSISAIAATCTTQHNITIGYGIPICAQRCLRHYYGNRH